MTKTTKYTMLSTKMTQYGNKIYPIVAEKYPDLAGKITGMFLGTGTTEFDETLDNDGYLQDLCEHPEFMEAQIKEAISTLELNSTSPAE